MAKKRAAHEDNGGGTAVADAPKRGRGRPPRQKMLNPDDPAFQRIRELEDLALALDTARSQRQSMLEDEIELQDKLVTAMKKHDLETYASQTGMLVLEHLITDKVKIKKVRQAKEDASLS
jgi:hypothetical protein